jgi:hypothetical protein
VVLLDYYFKYESLLRLALLRLAHGFYEYV